MAELGISEVEIGGIPALRLSGRLDFDTAPGLHQTVARRIRRGATRMVLDLHSLDYMDTSGLATLVDLQSQLEDRGGELVLCGVQPEVFEVFSINQVNGIFRVAEDEEQAADMLAGE